MRNRKKFKVIQINGFKGICFALASVCCIIAGFVVFPGMVAMWGWNFAAARITAMPPLGILQGVLLWGIIVISYMIAKKRQVMVSFDAPMELSDDEIRDVLEKVKLEMANEAKARSVTARINSSEKHDEKELAHVNTNSNDSDNQDLL